MQNPEYQFISTKFHLVGSMAALAEWDPLKHVLLSIYFDQNPTQ